MAKEVIILGLQLMALMIYRKLFFLLVVILLCGIEVLYAQVLDIGKTISLLDSVVIRAYQGKDLLHTPAAINYITQEQLRLYGPLNMVKALNTVPGVRMEERSPGSYRLNIRGSSIRSPYGVRNVKIYYNDIPFTAPGGTSMLNMLGHYQVSELEVIKGAGSSLYGAGTGGVLLMRSPTTLEGTTLALGGIMGSYGLKGLYGNAQFDSQAIGYEYLSSDGYRNHTAMSRKVLTWNGILKIDAHHKLNVNFIYGDLYYQTPGALTLTEYQLNPRLARPMVGNNPGAEEAKASIDQQSLLLGLTYKARLAKNIWQTTAIYGFYSQTQNPTIQNYERKIEPHGGGRTVFDYQLTAGNTTLAIFSGLEFQQGAFSSRTYRNVKGNKDTLRTDDQLYIRQLLGFVQANLSYRKWIFTAALSANSLNFDFKRWSEQPVLRAKKQYKGELMPRFALMYAVHKDIGAYLNVAKGFSPPSSNEIFADNSSYNLDLAAEKGWHYETGIRGFLSDKRLGFDISIFTTGLANAMVTRRDVMGGNYYVNAGKTSQKGLEGALNYELFRGLHKFSGSKIGANFSRYRFRYTRFVQDNNDYTGNVMPGIAPNTWTLLASVKMKNGLYGHFNYSYTSRIALNDANTAYASAFQLLTAKLGYQFSLQKMNTHFYVGADNLLNELYSLGNDINGFVGRYYNVSPSRSYYLGIMLNLKNWLK